MLEILVLLPFAAACIFLLSTRNVLTWSRGGQLAAMVLFATLSAVMLAAPRWRVQARLVVISDHPQGIGADALASTFQNLNPGFPYQVIQVSPEAKDDSQGLEAPEGPPRSPMAWRWHDGVSRREAPGGMAAKDVDSALALALGRFRDLSLMDRVWDVLSLRQNRVLVLVSQPLEWKKWRLDTAGHYASCVRQGVAVDVVQSSPGDPAASLELLCDTEVVAADSPWSETRFNLLLRLRSPELAKLAVEGRDYPCKVDCWIDCGLEDALAYAPGPSLPPLRAKRGAEGGLEVTVPSSLLLGSKKGLQSLFAGFHLVEAKLAVEIDGRKLAGGAARYLQAKSQSVTVVAGRGGRFSSQQPEANQSRLDVAIRGLKKWDNRWPPLLRCRFDVIDEVELGKASIDNFRVVHDLGEDAWLKHGASLRKFVEGGGHLLVCGPPRRELAPWLPASAREAGEKSEVLRQRRPSITFCPDSSSLGRLYERLVLGPKASYSTSPGKDLTGVALGAEAQLAFCNELLARLAAIPVFDRPVKAKLKERHVRSLDIEPHDSFVQTRVLAMPKPPMLDPESAASMLAESDLRLRVPMLQSDRNGRLAALAKQRAAAKGTPAVVQPLNEIAVVFLYEVKQHAEAAGKLAELLRDGWIVAPVRLKSPYADGVDQVGAGTGHTRTLSQVFADCRAQLLKDPGPGAGREAARRLVGDGQPAIDLAEPGAWRSEVARIADLLSNQLGPRLHPAGDFFVRHREGRFFDERIGPRLALGAPPSRIPPAERWAAPLMFQVLEPEGGEESFAATYASVGAADGVASDPSPISVGKPMGLGSVLCLGYSPFEGATEPELGDLAGENHPWGLVPQNRIFRAKTDQFDHWGIQRLIDYGGLAAELEPPVADEFRLRRVAPLEPAGKARFEVVRKMGDQAPPTLALKEPKGDGAATGQNLALNLVDLLPDRNTYVYECQPSQVRSLSNSDGAGKPLVVAEVAGVKVVLRVPERGTLPDLNGLAAAVVLARYSGGGEYDGPADLPPSTAGMRARLAVLLVLALMEFQTKQAATGTAAAWRAAMKAKPVDAELTKSEFGKVIVQGRPTTVSGPAETNSFAAKTVETYTWSGVFRQYVVKVYFGLGADPTVEAITGPGADALPLD